MLQNHSREADGATSIYTHDRLVGAVQPERVAADTSSKRKQNPEAQRAAADISGSDLAQSTKLVARLLKLAPN